MKIIHEKFMRLAIDKARQGIKNEQSPFGVCITKNEEVISCVHNAVWERTDITAHAEILTIREACKKLNTVDLSGFVLLYPCQPCAICFSPCHWPKFSTLLYGTRIWDA